MPDQQTMLPGYGFVSQTVDSETMLPGYGFINETQAPAVGGATVVPASTIQMGWYSPLGDTTSGGLIE